MHYKERIALLFKSMGEEGILQNSGFLDGSTLYNLNLTSKMSQIDKPALLQLIEQELTQYHSLNDSELKDIKLYYKNSVEQEGIAEWLKRDKSLSLETAQAVFIAACRRGFEVMLQKILTRAVYDKKLKSRLDQAIFNEHALHLTCSHKFPNPIGKAAIVTKLLEIIPKDQCLAVVLAKNKCGETVLQTAAYLGNEQLFSTLLEIIPKDQWLAVVLTKDKWGGTALHTAAHFGNEQILSTLLEIIPKDRRLAAVLTQNKYEVTVLHIAAYLGNEQILSTVLEIIPKDRRLAAVLSQNDWENTVLHLAVYSCNEQILSTVLEIIPKDRRLAAVLIQNKWKETVLHIATHLGNVQILSALLTTLPEEQRLAAVLSQNRWGNMILHKAAHSGNVQILSTLLTTLSEEQRLAAVVAQNNLGDTVLHMAACSGKLQLLSTLLDYLPEKNRLSAVMAKDNNNLTPLYHVFAILKKLPQDERLGIFKLTSKLSSLPEDSENLYRFYTLSPSLNETISGYQKQRSNRFFGSRASQTRQQAIGGLQQLMKDLESNMLSKTIDASDALAQLQAAVTKTKEETLQDHQQNASLRIGSYALTKSGFAAALARIEQAHGFSSNNALPTSSLTGLTRNR